MIRSAVTISLVPEALGGPFVLWDGISKGCAHAAAHGFTGVEIFPRSADEIDARELRETLDAYGLKLAAFGTGGGWVLKKLRLTDPDASVRAAAQKFIAGIIDRAAAFGAPAIIGSMQGRVEDGVTREQAIGWLKEALETLGRRARKHGVPLFFEPVNRYETNLVNSTADGVALLEALDTDNVKLLCDLFHMNIEEASIEASLRAAKGHLGHVHFADSNRRAAGLGHTDFTPIARALRSICYEGWLSAEILPVPDAETASRQTIKTFRALFATA